MVKSGGGKPYPEFVKAKIQGPPGLVGQVLEILKEHFISANSVPKRNREDRGVHVYVIIKGPR